MKVPFLAGRGSMVFTTTVGVMAVATAGSAFATSAGNGVGPGLAAATYYSGSPTVGVLFGNPTASGNHGCVASVVHSATHDVIMTAAHCVHGNGQGYTFVPGYHAGIRPYGVWTVTKAYAPASWVNEQSSLGDYVFLKVAKFRVGHGYQGIEDVTGANQLGVAPTSGGALNVSGYNYGVNDYPLHCSVKTYANGDFPAFNCDNFANGSSGSPWLQTVGGVTTVRGVIGGLHQGGCTSATSYSAPFTTETQQVLAEAEAGGVGNILPLKPDDGC